MKKIVILLAAGALATSVTAYAHHSFTATYLEKETVKIEGTIVQFLYRNPHSFVHVTAPDEKGVMQKWNIEWGGAGALAGQGVTRDTLKPGDPVVVTGNPGRDPADHRIRMVAVRRTTDGFSWGGIPGQVVD